MNKVVNSWLEAIAVHHRVLSLEVSDKTKLIQWYVNDMYKFYECLFNDMFHCILPTWKLWLILKMHPQNWEESVIAILKPATLLIPQ